MSKWLEHFKEKKPNQYLYQCDKVDIVKLETTVSTMSQGNQPISEKKLINEMAKKEELRQLIQKVGQHYKASDAEIEEMYLDTLEYHSLDNALKSFRNSVTTLPPLKN